MKFKTTLFAAVGCALVLASGCSKKDESPPPTPASKESVGVTATNVAGKAAAPVAAQTEAAKQAVQAAATNIQAQAAGATNRVQGIIEQARKLLAENKPSDALALLNGLTGQQLSPDQQSLVQSLKDQIQKAVEGAAKAKATSEATKAVGGLLQPKK
jgi:hypothetical protein